MSKQVCMAVGCDARATEHMALEEAEVANGADPIWTHARVCSGCESLLSAYFDGEPITFDGFPISDIRYLHKSSNREGFAELVGVYFIPAEDDFDFFDVGLFDKEPLNIDGTLVDVEMD